MGLELLRAPSRINEPLCMSIDDFATIDAYARQAADSSDPTSDAVYGAHQMLIITMKGSKGSPWGPKPVLSFMMQFFHNCMDRIKDNGKRSRMLVEWYQENPDTLYIPEELDHLRGQDLSVIDVDRIMQLGGTSKRDTITAARRLFASRMHAVKWVKNSIGTRGEPR